MHDLCTYISDGAILNVHVDDILLAAMDGREMGMVKQPIAEPFGMIGLGELRHFVGVTVDQRKEVTWIGQPAYTGKILEMFNMGEAKPVATPVDTSFKLTKSDATGETMDRELYQSAVGSLLYPLV